MSFLKADADSSLISSPSTLTSPLSSGTTPISTLSSSVLPQPFGPVMQVICPLWAISDSLSISNRPSTLSVASFSSSICINLQTKVQKK